MRETSASVDLPPALAERLQSSQQALSVSAERLAQSRQRLRETLDSLHRSRSQREILHEVAYARLLARLESMPVIEQAKGIVMAQSHCSAEEAFAMLRAASQRSNMKVKDLAEQIVGRVSSDQPPATPRLS